MGKDATTYHYATSKTNPTKNAQPNNKPSKCTPANCFSIHAHCWIANILSDASIRIEAAWDRRGIRNHVAHVEFWHTTCPWKRAGEGITEVFHYISQDRYVVNSNGVAVENDRKSDTLGTFTEMIKRNNAATAIGLTDTDLKYEYLVMVSTRLQ